MSLRVESTDQDERVLARLRGAGLNLTSNRRTILPVFLAGTEPVTITDLWLRTKKADPRTSYGTVWRLLTALVECGLAHSGNLSRGRDPSLWTGEGGMHSRAHGVQGLRRRGRERLRGKIPGRRAI